MPGYRSLLADMLGLRFIATGVPVERIDPGLKPGDLTLLARTDQAYIYENPRVMPRVMVVGEARRADMDAILASGEWPSGFDPRRQVLVGPGAPLPPTPGVRPAGQARILDYGTDSVTIETVSPQGGFLVLNDVWQPWWRAEVNGTPAEMLRANVLFSRGRRAGWARDSDLPLRAVAWRARGA